jgi:hypothetical protein
MSFSCESITDIFCDYPAAWKKGKKLRIRNIHASNYPLPPTIDDVEYIGCELSELDLRMYGELDVLAIRHHIGPAHVYFPPRLRCLILDNSDLVCMTPLPIHLSVLIVRESNFQHEIAHLPNLERLVWDYQTSSILPPLPTNLKSLHCAHSNLERLPDPLPSRLDTLICDSCLLTELPPLPLTLEHIRCHDMNISCLPSLPAGLLTLDFQNCALTVLPPLPKRLDELDVRNNCIAHIPEIPDTTDYVNICGNPVETYPYIYRTNLWIVYDYNLYVAVFTYPKFHVDRMIVFSPLHLLDGLDTRLDDDPFLDIYEDEGFQHTLIQRLQVMCEIQKQVACRAFMNTIKEELMMRTWHPSRVEDWCGVNFDAMDD